MRTRYFWNSSANELRAPRKNQYFIWEYRRLAFGLCEMMNWSFPPSALFCFAWAFSSSRELHFARVSIPRSAGHLQLNDKHSRIVPRKKVIRVDVSHCAYFIVREFGRKTRVCNLRSRSVLETNAVIPAICSTQTCFLLYLLSSICSRCAHRRYFSLFAASSSSSYPCLSCYRSLNGFAFLNKVLIRFRGEGESPTPDLSAPSSRRSNRIFSRHREQSSARACMLDCRQSVARSEIDPNGTDSRNWHRSACTGGKREVKQTRDEDKCLNAGQSIIGEIEIETRSDRKESPRQ